MTESRNSDPLDDSNRINGLIIHAEEQGNRALATSLARDLVSTYANTRERSLRDLMAAEEKVRSIQSELDSTIPGEEIYILISRILSGHQKIREGYRNIFDIRSMSLNWIVKTYSGYL